MQNLKNIYKYLYSVKYFYKSPITYLENKNKKKNIT